MKKWIFIFLGIILIGISIIAIKINNDLDDLVEALNSEHALTEPNLIIHSDSISPNEQYIYYKYQFDKGGLGYSRLFWSVIKNDINENDLGKGLIAEGYEIIGWNEKNELILKERNTTNELDTVSKLENGSKVNGIKININE